jgi:hypothetical protein
MSLAERVIALHHADQTPITPEFNAGHFKESAIERAEASLGQHSPKLDLPFALNQILSDGCACLKLRESRPCFHLAALQLNRSCLDGSALDPPEYEAVTEGLSRAVIRDVARS